MLNTKRLFSFMLMVFFFASALAAPLAAQDSGGTASRQASLNLMVFRGIYGADGLSIRKKTLKDIENAVEQGNTSDEIYAALEYMSMEGLKNKSMERGKIINDYPEIRGIVADQLGKIGTVKATELLIQLCNAERKNEYYVMQKIIIALGEIGINENDTTVRAIVWNVRNYSPSRPEATIDRVIYSAIDAVDKIEKKNEGINNQKDFDDVQEFLKRVSEGHFSTPVRDRAKHVLEDILRRKTERR
jgi:HEAT repeat protein